MTNALTTRDKHDMLDRLITDYERFQAKLATGSESSLSDYFEEYKVLASRGNRDLKQLDFSGRKLGWNVLQRVLPNKALKPSAPTNLDVFRKHVCDELGYLKGNKELLKLARK